MGQKLKYGGFVPTGYIYFVDHRLYFIIIWSRDTRLTILITFRGWISQYNLSIAKDRNNLSVLILNLLRIRDVIIYNLMTLHSYHNTCGNIWIYDHVREYMNIWSRDTRLTILITFRGWISQYNLSIAKDRNNLSVLILNLLRIRDVIIYNLMTLHSYHNTCGNIWKITGQFTQVFRFQSLSMNIQ